MVYGIAFSWNPRNWRLGWSDAVDVDPNTGREVVIGQWFFVGPVALTMEYE